MRELSGAIPRWAQVRSNLRTLALALAPVALWFTAPDAFAQEARTARCPPAAHIPSRAELQQLLNDARDRGLLWRIEQGKGQGSRTSWLYGTIHVAAMDWMVPGPTVMNALRDSDALALELNVIDPNVMNALMSALRAQPGAAPLPPALAERLEKFKQQECVGEEVNALRPEAQVITLATFIARREGLDPSFGIDITLAGVATSLGKQVMGLESVDTQIRELVTDDPDKVQKAVSTGLDQLERKDAGRLLATLAQAWADGRMGLIETYPEWCDCVKTDADRADLERLIAGRNPAMARAIVAEINAGKNVFAAVGALHMAGPKGLPQLLAQQGFKVTRVDFPAPPPVVAK